MGQRGETPSRSLKGTEYHSEKPDHTEDLPRKLNTNHKNRETEKGRKSKGITGTLTNPKERKPNPAETYKQDSPGRVPERVHISNTLELAHYTRTSVKRARSER